MEIVMTDHVLDQITSDFAELCKHPEIYIEKRHEESEKFKWIAEKIYNYVKASNSLTDLKSKSLKKLLIDGFDEEQIWQQIELQNNSALTHLSQVLSGVNPEIVSFSSKNPSKQISDGESSSEFSGEEGYVFDDDSSVDLEELAHKRLQNVLENLKEGKIAEDNTANKKVKGNEKKKLLYKSKVDDQFFKLSELDEYLKLEDLKEEKEDLSYQESLNLFEDIPSDDIDDLNSDSEAEETKKSSRDLMYEDFFDAPVSGDEGFSDGKNSGDEKRNSESEVDFEHETLDQDFKSATKNKSEKSGFELEQEKVRKTIEECENKLLQPLPWHLTGEVAAANRPVDSLLHQETDFNCKSKKELIVDNTLNDKVESILKLAYINKAFCDPKRMSKPTEDVIAYKRQIVLEQTKSKKGLAEVYEEDYLKKKSKQEEEEDPKHIEIKKLMDSLFPDLHALFTHIPKPSVPEIKVVSNLPAITVEEVAPTGVSDVTLLAPEEIKRKTGLIKSKTERTDTDRKRERRKKKLFQKMKEKKKQEKLNADESKSSARMSKLQKLEVLKKLKAHRNTKIGKVDDEGKIKSSKDFFSRLQDTVDSKVKQQKVKKKNG